MKDNNAKMYGFCIFVFYQYPQAVKMLVLVCLIMTMYWKGNQNNPHTGGNDRSKIIKK